MKFGEKLQELRKEKGVSQEDVSKAIGMTLRNYASYEHGVRYPRNRDVYRKLSEYFGVDQNYLLTEDEDFIIEAADKYGSRGRRQAEDLVTDMIGLFAGGDVSDEDKDAIMRALMKAYIDCKEDNKKYTPKKYRSEKE